MFHNAVYVSYGSLICLFVYLLFLSVIFNYLKQEGPVWNTKQNTYRTPVILI